MWHIDYFIYIYIYIYNILLYIYIYIYSWKCYSYSHILNPLSSYYFLDFTCSVYEKEVLETDKGIGCDHCKNWTHHKCNELSDFHFYVFTK